MHLRFKGYGYTVWFVIIGAFFIVPPLIEANTGSSGDALRRHINAAVLSISGVVIFWIAAKADKKNGINVFSKHAWTSDITISEHMCFSIPMRLFAVLLLLISLFL